MILYRDSCRPGRCKKNTQPRNKDIESRSHIGEKRKNKVFLAIFAISLGEQNEKYDPNKVVYRTVEFKTLIEAAKHSIKNDIIGEGWVIEAKKGHARRIIDSPYERVAEYSVFIINGKMEIDLIQIH